MVYAVIDTNVLVSAIFAVHPDSATVIVREKIMDGTIVPLYDAEIFDEIPVKKEVKATVSGLYITKVRGLRGGNAPVDAKKKKGLRAWALNKRKELEAQSKNK